MFSIFKNNSIGEARIFMGSSEEDRDKLSERRSPYDGEVVSTAPICTAEDTNRALAIAQEASKATMKSPLHQRVAWLEDVADMLREYREDMAMTLVNEVAKPLAFARVEVDRCIETIEITAKELIALHGETIPTDIAPSGKKTIAYFSRVPVGVVACITPFNFPLNLVAHKIAPALGAGNAVVLKPTPEAPLTAYKLAKLFNSSQYAIKDALSVVYGDVEVGSTLVKSSIPRVLSFTGSVPVGNIITQQAGIKKVSLELGGNAATYIDSSADLEYAASRCAFGAFVNSGQVCISLQRIYVHASIYDAFATELATETKTLKVGSPYEEDTFMGPLIDEESLHRAKSWVASAQDEGAILLTGGRVVDNSFTPTVMTEVTDEMKIVCEEVFAPIVSLVKVDSYEEAIEKMNNSPYGLQFSIFTNDLKLTQRFIDDAQCGGVVINDIPTLRFDVQPYGGSKLSGVGRRVQNGHLKSLLKSNQWLFVINMQRPKVALSACLTGCACRYDGDDNLNESLLKKLEAFEIVPFCPEEHCFGTPRPTMDLVDNEGSIVAVSNETAENLSEPIIQYAEDFFKHYSDIKLFIGKDRSPSCAVRSGKVYNVQKELIDTHGSGLMAKVALDLGIESWDSEAYELNHTS